MSKARPAQLRSEWRRAGFTSARARGCPGRHLGAASLGQSAAGAALLLAGHTSLGSDIGDTFAHHLFDYETEIGGGNPNPNPYPDPNPNPNPDH